MLNAFQNPLSLIGRLLLAFLFIPAGISKISGFEGTVGYIASVGLPLPIVAAAGTIALEIGAGLMLAVGWKTRWAALALAAFTLLATIIFHNFWAMPADKAFVQQLMFFKNIAVVGGLLVVAAFGAGRLSLDGRSGQA